MKEEELNLLYTQLKNQFPNRQVTVLYDRLTDKTTIRIDLLGLSPDIYYWAAKGDEQK